MCPIYKMASASRVFSQSFRFARNLKVNGCRVQGVASAVHVSTSARKLTNARMARPLASVCGLLNGATKCNIKTKLQFASQQQVSNVSLVAKSAGLFSTASQGSDETSVSTSEGSDSSCEAMEGPHSDDDGLVISDSSTTEDL